MINPSRAMVSTAASRLDGAAPWAMVSATPVGDRVSAPALDPTALRRWIIAETSVWPAPLPFGSAAPHRVGDRMVVTGRGDLGERAETCYADFGEHGSATVALRIGAVEDSRPDDAGVWAIGEGAVVWFVLAAARLAAAHGIRTYPQGAATLRVDLIPPDDGRPLQLWKRQDGVHQASAPARIATADSACVHVGLAECLSPRLAQAVRPALDEIFGQFAVDDVRHITDDGALRASRFTGHADRISTWARTIRVPYEP